MPDPLRLLLIGAGRMGRFHAEALAESDEISLVAIADADPSIAEQLAAATGIPAVAISGIEHVPCDAWLIAASTPAHVPLVLDAVAAGKHVLCEKPLSLETADGDRATAAAQEAGLILQVGFWRRSAPPWAEAKRLLDTGAIGEPVLVRLAQWDADPPPPQFCDPAVSGGLAIDCGVHEYDLAEWLLDMPVRRVTTFPLRGVDEAVVATGDVDNVLAVLEFDGVVATVDLSRNARYGDDVRTEILGSEGAIFVELLPHGRTRLATADGIAVVPESEVDDAMAAGVRLQARAFADAVRSTGNEADPGIPDGAASGRALAIGRAIQRSAVTGRSEPV